LLLLLLLLLTCGASGWQQDRALLVALQVYAQHSKAHFQFK
jgi:hypothetical protein